MLSSHLRPDLPSDLFPSGFPTKTLSTPLLRKTITSLQQIRRFISNYLWFSSLGLGLLSYYFVLIIRSYFCFIALVCLFCVFFSVSCVLFIVTF